MKLKFDTFICATTIMAVLSILIAIGEILRYASNIGGLIAACIFLLVVLIFIGFIFLLIIVTDICYETYKSKKYVTHGGGSEW